MSHTSLARAAKRAAAKADRHSKAQNENGLGDILVVDDLPNNLDLLRSILTRAGYRVRTAKSGPLALKIIERKAPDLVLLDINMPDVDGFEVCRRIKALEGSNASIPVIFVSALDGVLEKVRGFKSGGVDYVVKPFQAEEVLMRVQNHLEIHRLRRELEKRNRELERKQRKIEKSKRKVERVFSTLADVLPGTQIDDKYAVGRKIGSGGYGAVYEGEHLNLGRRVAIKVLQPVTSAVTQDTFERFLLEGISACRIRHPNAVEVLDAGVSDRGIAYLVMELLEGFTVRQLLRRQGSLSVRRAAGIVAPVASVLAQAAGMGLVHRDVKPENIFLHHDPRADGEVVKLVDFGIAKILDGSPGEAAETRCAEKRADGKKHIETGSLSEDGTSDSNTGLIGTPFYMAPERLLDAQDTIQSDLYSLGVSFYEMVAGRRPFDGEDQGLGILMKICQSEPVELAKLAPRIPQWVSDFVMKLLKKDPQERPRADEVQRFFENLAAADLSDEIPVDPTLPRPVEATTLPVSVMVDAGTGYPAGIATETVNGLTVTATEALPD